MWICERSVETEFFAATPCAAMSPQRFIVMRADAGRGFCEILPRLLEKCPRRLDGRGTAAANASFIGFPLTIFTRSSINSDTMHQSQRETGLWRNRDILSMKFSSKMSRPENAKRLNWYRIKYRENESVDTTKGMRKCFLYKIKH